MNEKDKLRKAIFTKIYVLAAVILLFFAFIIIRLFENSAEFWTRTYYRFLQSAFGPVVSLIPFSIAEVFFILFGVAIITLIILIIIDWSKKRGLAGVNKALTLLVVVTSTITYYFSTAGVGYGRSPVDIPQYEQQVENSEYVDIVEYFRDDFNECASALDFSDEGGVIRPYTISEISELLKIEYSRLESDYFTAYTSKVKSMFLSFLFREFNIPASSYAPPTDPTINN